MTDTKNSFIVQITSYVDAYLTAAAKARSCQKEKLCIYMYLSLSNDKPQLLNLLYLDNKEFINFITIKQVVTGLAAMFSGTIERKIIEGFENYAKESQLIAMQLKLRLFYKEGNLIYQVFYQDKPITVDLEKFFVKE